MVKTLGILVDSSGSMVDMNPDETVQSLNKNIQKIANEDTNIKEEILIKHDRAIMEGNIKVNNAFFNSLPWQLGNKKTIVVYLYQH